MIDAQKKGERLTAVSLFTGAGGLDLGIELAGFDIKLCVELDSDCRATLKENRPNWKLAEPGDIYELGAKKILKQAGLKRKELTLLTGGPPCQPFSKAGYWINGDSARLDDPRSDTLAAYMRVVEAMLPKCVLLENVKGLGYQNKDEGMELLKARFKKINKKHKVNYVPRAIVINAADYGVPQMRERIFVVAERNGRNFAVPKKKNCSHDSCNRRLCKLKRYTTAWDAIGHLEEAHGLEDLALRGKWADLLPSIPEGSNYLWHTPRSDGEPLFGWRTRYWSFLLKLAKHLPSWTIQASPGPATGPFHWKNRQLSIAELCHLQTFPENYKVVGTRLSAYRQIGNAVPSAIGELLGFEIRKQLMGHNCRAKQTLVPREREGRPDPEPITPVPRKYMRLRADHEEHPGPGLGPLALSR
jgi:DNA (cytosine-5)-methyltransferase 1